MANPWDIPSSPTSGDDSLDTLYQAVGRALTEWEHVESALGDLFAFLVGAPWEYPSKQPAVRAYGSVISFQQRATMLIEAAEAYFNLHPDENLTHRFSRIVSTECREFSSRRNEIAHGRVQAAFESPMGGRLSNFLTPGLYASKKWRPNEPPKYIYTSKEIDYFRNQFEELYDRIRGLVVDMMDVQRAFDRKSP